MAKDPTIPFYAQDFYIDTLQWSEAEVGAYTRLLCTLWINGFCYNSAIELAMVSPLAKHVVDKYSDKFVFYDDNKFSSKRLEEERAKRIRNRELRSSAGKKGAEKRWQKGSKGNSKQYGKKIAKVNERENEKKMKRYGEYKNVLLTNKQYNDLKDKVDDRNGWIKIMDEAIEEKGNIWHIKNFYLAILKWYKKDNPTTNEKTLYHWVCPKGCEKDEGHTDDMAEDLTYCSVCDKERVRK